MKFNLFLKKQYFLIVILISCKTDSSNNSVVDEIAVFEDKVFEDKGISNS